MSKIKGTARLLVPAGKASPSPAIGQALGPLGVNMMEFCKSFNARTINLKDNVPTPVNLTAFEDRSFEFKTKTPPTSWLLKQAAGIEKGAAKPGEETVGTVSIKHVYEIAKIKKTDEHLQHIHMKGLVKSIISSAKSMGIAVEGYNQGKFRRS
uniref:Large ribosomal subunit protein uL11m n=1 Tax=Aplanochytrium stocchinoi TaxID=215587 RepID=A0A7S3LP89_9STRA|mmetsp:Transcript_9062/g.11342  ORF Transcript_9062/g.11342 Transcript_9062/m.11342 type:complete len:153 (+) Transcript_9062:67-525(+)